MFGEKLQALLDDNDISQASLANELGITGQAVKKRFRAINLNNHTPYDCRHTFATLMDRAKADEHSIKLIMGHSIKDLTKRVYTHKDIEQLITEVNKI